MVADSSNNRNTAAAQRYHDATKHSWHSVHTTAHHMDWDNQPIPFKVYPDLDGQPLPNNLPSSEAAALSALTALLPAQQVEPTLRDLAGLFYFGAGITKRGVIPGGQIYFRAAACTGALYHVELYLVCGGMTGLADGVYHFGPHDFSLRQLRAGDYRGTLAAASGGEPSVTQAPAILVTTSVYWRNAWKYQSRAYRHSWWDSGTILANLLAIAGANGLPLGVVTSFVDDPVNRLLDLDEDREAVLHLLPVGRVDGNSPPAPPEIAPLGLEVSPYSRREVDYPQIREMHTASCLALPGEAAELRGGPPALTGPDPLGELFPINPTPEEELPVESIESVIVRRGSSRQFRREPITFTQLSNMLLRATQDLPADFLGNPGATLNQLYLIVNDVAGLPSGSYVYHPHQMALEQLKEGEFRQEAGYLGLQQELPADASVNVYFLTDLSAVLAKYGNRGYRMAQTEAAIRAGQLYLAAYAQRLGASGLTFFDDDVTEFFSPHAAGKSVMFLIALGRPRPRRRASR